MIRRRSRDRATGSARAGLAAIGVAAFAVVCCAAVPLLVVIASGLALGTLLGAGAGAGILLTVTTLLIVRNRRRGCTPVPSPTTEKPA